MPEDPFASVDDGGGPIGCLPPPSSDPFSINTTEAATTDGGLEATPPASKAPSTTVVAAVPHGVAPAGEWISPKVTPGKGGFWADTPRYSDFPPGSWMGCTEWRPGSKGRRNYDPHGWEALGGPYCPTCYAWRPTPRPASLPPHDAVLAAFRKRWPVGGPVPDEVAHPRDVRGWTGTRDPALDEQAARVWLRARKRRMAREKRQAKAALKATVSGDTVEATVPHGTVE
jgi:hypothetical protein